MKPAKLYIDIETYPTLARIWQLYEGNALEVEKAAIICCFSAKFDGHKQITKALPDYPLYKKDPEDDTAILSDIYSLLNESDIVIAHNGKQFDVRRINARFIAKGFDPPRPYKVVDTKELAARIFGFGKNTLDYLCQYLGIGKKMATGGYELWQGCMKGDPKSWARMKKYNAHDVVLLEGLYNKLLPWMDTHPNAAVYQERSDICSKCGSNKLQPRGIKYNKTRTYRQFQCAACGGWSSSTVSSSAVKIN